VFCEKESGGSIARYLGSPAKSTPQHLGRNMAIALNQKVARDRKSDSLASSNLFYTHTIIMSQQQKNEFSEKLMISASGQLVASQKIPQIARPFVSEKALKYLDIV
jgi:hypothetical protein